MGDDPPTEDTVTLIADAAALRDLVTACGWRVADDGLVLLVDARADMVVVSTAEAAALPTQAALLAIVDDDAGADRAYELGATHILIGTPAGDGLARALRFAGRHARRLRGIGRTRRAGEQIDAVGAFLAAQPLDAPLTVADAALTRFDLVNDAFGRDAGDALLAAAGERILACLPAAAVIERGVGAGFSLAIAAPPEAAEVALTAIEATMTAPFAVGPADANLGMRIGVAHRAPGEPKEALRRRAREALNAARAADGATLHVADTPSGAPALRLAADLHRAIDGREIDILFQPQVSLDSDAIIGVEALARWEHPQHGVLGAETLFAAAERADLGLALSEHIQTIALARVAAWPSSLALLRVAVNVTAADLARGDFAERFLARIEASAVSADRITAEITETGMIADRAAASLHLDRLRAAGVRVAIDDFGTGYSSLDYLTALPLDYLKIDRSLVQHIVESARDRIVVRGVIAIAGGLGLETIVEGVETEAQRALLAAEGATTYQGFLRAGPLDDAALVALVEGE